MNFNQKRPCNNCPFRTDCPTEWLGEDKVKTITNTITITSDQLFPCHKSLDIGKEGTQCAGALLLAQKEQKINANRQFRMAKVWGKLQEIQLKGKQLVFYTIQQMVEHHTKS